MGGFPARALDRSFDPRMTRASILRFAIARAVLISAVGPPAPCAPQHDRNGEWPTYGGDLANSKYSPLDQITAANFAIAQARVAREVARRLPQHHAARRIRMVGGFKDDLRRAQSPRSETVARWAAAVRPELQGDAADGRRNALRQHALIGRRRVRRQDRRAQVGLQPQELRSRHHHHEPAVEPARRGVLDRRHRRTDLLGHRRRLS